MQFGNADFLKLAGRPLGSAAFAVEHVGARHVMLAGAHQRQFDLVLDVLDMHRAAVRRAPGQRIDHGLG